MRKHITRSFFGLSCIVSLLLCMAIGWLWARSYGKQDLIEYYFAVSGELPHAEIYLTTGQGGIGLCLLFASQQDSTTRFSWRSDQAPSGYGGGGWPNETFWDRRGFSLGVTRSMDYVVYGIVAPAWSYIVATLVLPITGLYMTFRKSPPHATRPLPLLRLRFAHDPERCPECGTVAKLAT